MFCICPISMLTAIWWQQSGSRWMVDGGTVDHVGSKSLPPHWMIYLLYRNQQRPKVLLERAADCHRRDDGRVRSKTKIRLTCGCKHSTSPYPHRDIRTAQTYKDSGTQWLRAFNTGRWSAGWLVRETWDFLPNYQPTRCEMLAWKNLDAWIS